MSANEIEDDEPHYTVDRMLRKQIVDGVVYYLVEWRGDDGSEGIDWEPEDNLVSADPTRCEIKKFNRLWDAYQKRLEKERRRKAEGIIGAKASRQKKDTNDVFVKPAVPTKKSKPKKMPSPTDNGRAMNLLFPELMVVAEKVKNTKTVMTSKITRKGRPTRLKERTPEKIVGVAGTTAGNMKFVLKWKDLNTTDLISVREANLLYPQLVIEFYQERITWVKRK